MRVRGFVTYYTYFDHGSNKNSKPFQFPKPEGRGDVYNTYESIELLKAWERRFRSAQEYPSCYFRSVVVSEG